MINIGTSRISSKIRGKRYLQRKQRVFLRNFLQSNLRYAIIVDFIIKMKIAKLSVP